MTGGRTHAEGCWGWRGHWDCAVAEIERLRAEVERLKAALKTVGDDYPGSSCQSWCYEQAGLSLPTPAAPVPQSKSHAKRVKALTRMDLKKFEKAPCYICGYNGPNYYHPEVHECAGLYHEQTNELP